MKVHHPNTEQWKIIIQLIFTFVVKCLIPLFSSKLSVSQGQNENIIVYKLYFLKVYNIILSKDNSAWEIYIHVCVS